MEDQMKATKKDATRRLEIEQEILELPDRPQGYTVEQALKIVVPHEANGDHCAHCHRILHMAWDSLVSQGLIEAVK
jgi:hypothetical protein